MSDLEYGSVTGCCKQSSEIATSIKYDIILDYLHERLVPVVKEMKGVSVSKARDV
jgi:hypothetical protein